MGKQLNALEKEFLIRRFRDNPNISIGDFCEVDDKSINSQNDEQKNANLTNEKTPI